MNAEDAAVDASRARLEGFQSVPGKRMPSCSARLSISVRQLFSNDCRRRQVPQLTDGYPARPRLQNAGRGGLLESMFYLPGHVLWALNSSLY
jgi:hypothetical protein